MPPPWSGSTTLTASTLLVRLRVLRTRLLTGCLSSTRLRAGTAGHVQLQRTHARTRSATCTFPGTKGGSAGHAPSAALLKATLLAGAATMTGIARATGAALAPPPTPFQGFGRVDLSASLPLAGDRRGYRLQVIDGAFFEADGLEHTYNITVAASTNTSSPPMPLIVTLVWFDIPAFPGARYVLVNNLDLKVEMAGGGNAWLGNGGASNNASIPDYRNNVEKVGSWRTATRADMPVLSGSPA